MRTISLEWKTLSGSLLVAMPTLLDPNFRRTILFMVRHEQDEGAMGVILNRPQGKTLGDLEGAGSRLPSGPVPLFEGGPVEQHQLLLARMTMLERGARFESFGEEDLSSVELSGSPDPEELRAFIGYAGWTVGQLEREIAEQSWLVLAPSPALLQPVTSPEEGAARWRGIMMNLGPWHHLLAQAPDDPGLN